ncbi:hypothetical protein [Streptomyces sp. NBC_01237]|uniref:hypothetical protein n=1 Tax=Streptomyces sp. NBC_01237 TaxID=2903790 RepID=UPI002DDA113A|nr:hypothetical protein [Streptomyces sp. NBC_01237]WRZ70296.1 hypothetical protein OG251_00895 [Streptomyces sp. NBC_01237]
METRSKDVASRFLEETEERDRIPAYDDLCTADYREHDPAMPQETVVLAEAREIYRELVTAFELTVIRRPFRPRTPLPFWWTPLTPGHLLEKGC